MAKKSSKSGSGNNVTVERSGARSVNLGRIISSPQGRKQLRQVGRIQSSLASKGQKK